MPPPPPELQGLIVHYHPSIEKLRGVTQPLTNVPMSEGLGYHIHYNCRSFFRDQYVKLQSTTRVCDRLHMYIGLHVIIVM